MRNSSLPLSLLIGLNTAQASHLKPLPAFLSQRTRHHFSRSATNVNMAQNNFVVDPFCYRQFAEKESSKGYAGTVL
jgi:hypothetical protein